MVNHPYHFILLGPPGSGKGTQAVELARRFRLVHLEMGGVLREEAKRRTPLGRRLNRIVNERGTLVPMTIMSRVVANVIRKIPATRGIVFDGFPRSRSQRQLLERLLPKFSRSLTAAIYLPVTVATTIRRLSKRRQCEKRGHRYILGKTLARTAVRCPKDGSRIFQRADDHPAAIRRRLAVYRRHTHPLTEHFRERGLLIRVDGEPPIPTVTRLLAAALARRGIPRHRP